MANVQINTLIPCEGIVQDVVNEVNLLNINGSVNIIGPLSSKLVTSAMRYFAIEGSNFESVMNGYGSAASFKFKNFGIDTFNPEYNANGKCCQISWFEKDERFKRKDFVKTAKTASTSILFSEMVNAGKFFYFIAGDTYKDLRVTVAGKTATGAAYFQSVVVDTVTSTGINFTTAIDFPKDAVITVNGRNPIGGSEQFDCGRSPDCYRRGASSMQKKCADVHTFEYCISLTQCEGKYKRRNNDGSDLAFEDWFKKRVLEPEGELFFNSISDYAINRLIDTIVDADTPTNPTIIDYTDCICGANAIAKCPEDVVRMFNNDVLNKLATSGSDSFVLLSNTAMIRELGNLSPAFATFNNRYTPEYLTVYSPALESLYMTDVSIKTRALNKIETADGRTIRVVPSAELDMKTFNPYLGADNNMSMGILFDESRVGFKTTPEMYGNSISDYMKKKVSDGYAEIYIGRNEAELTSGSVPCDPKWNGSTRMAFIMQHLDKGGYYIITGLKSTESCNTLAACANKPVIGIVAYDSCL